MKKSITLFILGIFYSIQLFSCPLCNSPYKALWNTFLSSQNLHSKALRYAITDNIEDYSINEALLTTICQKSASKPLLQEALPMLRNQSTGIPIKMPNSTESSFYSNIAQIIKKHGARIIKYTSDQNVLVYLEEFANRIDFPRPNTGSFTEAIIDAFPGVVWKAGDGKGESYIAHSIVPCSADKISDKLNAIFENYNNQITTKTTKQQNRKSLTLFYKQSKALCLSFHIVIVRHSPILY